MKATVMGGRRLMVAALGTILMAGACLAGPDRGSTRVTHVKAAASTVAADGTQTVTFTLDIDPGWHLYANPVGNADMADLQTTLKFQGDLAGLNIAYPPGRAEDSYRIYENQVVIRATLRRRSGDLSSLEATLRFQACSSKSCLQPSTVRLKIPAR